MLIGSDKIKVAPTSVLGLPPTNRILNVRIFQSGLFVSDENQTSNCIICLSYVTRMDKQYYVECYTV